MQVSVQKSTSTTRPRSPAGSSGSEFSHAVAPPSEGTCRRPDTVIDDLPRSRDELLAAVDVVGRAGEGRVGHEGNGERRDVGRSDHPADGERRAQLLAPGLESVGGEVRGRQRRVDEARGDEVDAYRGELEREG